MCLTFLQDVCHSIGGALCKMKTGRPVQNDCVPGDGDSREIKHGDLLTGGPV